MVLLFERLCHSLKFHSNLENHHHHHDNHHHHQSEAALSASLEAFRSNLTKTFNQFLSNSKPESQSLSLSWIHHSFELFPLLNKAFTNLLVEIEHPFNKWESVSIEEYSNYTLNLLGLLNSISSSLSSLGQSRLSLSHALHLLRTSPYTEIDRLKPIEPSRCLSKDLIEVNDNYVEGSSILFGRELIIHQAMIMLKSISFWACGVFLSSLSNNHDQTIYLGENSSTIDLELDSIAFTEIMEKKGVLKEVIEVNDAINSLVNQSKISEEYSGEKMEDLGQKMEVLEKMVDCVGKEADHLFREVLTSRNELLDCLRLKTI